MLPGRRALLALIAASPLAATVGLTARQSPKSDVSRRADGPPATADRRPPTADTYLFAYFTGNGEHGLRFARSDDGLRWRRVADGRVYLAPTVGGRLMRDPSIVAGSDGQYHMVWTTGWWDRGFGVSHSRDLKTWSAPSFVPVLPDEPGVRNVWAPEIHHDARAGQYVIVWASTIAGRFPETAHVGDAGQDGQRLNHRLYATTTSDFLRYTPARLFYDGGFSAIDGVVVRDGDDVVLVVKDETRYPEPRKDLRIARGTAIAGPFGPADAAFSPSWVEGPTVLRLGDHWRVYYDEYTRKRYGAMDTRDFRTFTPVADVTFPEGMRHGTAFTVPSAIADALER
ncbi:MAG TPA: glycoside hydrolase family 43 protein [Luteitalea sp.]|nr:glycoside hydrolase family 43 protein [Luteitalea sp.]